MATENIIIFVMSEKFSYVYHTIIIILQESSQIFPGLQQVL